MLHTVAVWSGMLTAASRSAILERLQRAFLLLGVRVSFRELMS